MSRPIFVTGANGFLGGYASAFLLEDPEVRLAALVRGRDREEAVGKLWQSWQLHMSAERFREVLPRVRWVQGDLHAPGLGIDPAVREELVADLDSVLHIAASLNRKSEKACLNTNLRGTLSVIGLARAARDAGGLRRFTHVSTVAVAGQRDREVVQEDQAIDWNRSDYDPYGRTKKFCEHMARELLPDVPKTFLRPSIVMGDSRFQETSQFDMVRTFCAIADLPVIPLRPDIRLDIVPADWVGRAIATIHRTEGLAHDIFHLSAGEGSCTASAIAAALVAGQGRAPARFAPGSEGSFELSARAMNRVPGRNPVAGIGALLKVFLPYIRYDTVFDNRRAVAATGLVPTPFVDYCARLYGYAKEVGYRYPARPLPPGCVEALA